MAKVCLECGTPKYPVMALNQLNTCYACNKVTHAVDSKPRRLQCHDCLHFKVKCQDGSYRAALDYGQEFLDVAVCRGADGMEESRFRNMLIERVAKQINQYDQRCDRYQRHHKAPTDNRPNPLTIQERKEWKDYLQSPSAFWLDPKRWDKVVDPHQQKFWDQDNKKSGGKGKAIMGAAVLLGGLFMARKKAKRDDEVQGELPVGESPALSDDQGSHPGD